MYLIIKSYYLKSIIYKILLGTGTTRVIKTSIFWFIPIRRRNSLTKFLTVMEGGVISFWFFGTGSPFWTTNMIRLISGYGLFKKLVLSNAKGFFDKEFLTQNYFDQIFFDQHIELEKDCKVQNLVIKHNGAKLSYLDISKEFRFKVRIKNIKFSLIMLNNFKLIF